MIEAKVVYTTYEASKTRKGTPCLLVTYHCPPFESIKQWLFRGSDELERWWGARTRSPFPPSIEQAAQMAKVGKLKPTKLVRFVRDGRWPKIDSTVVGEYPDAIVRFMREAREIDPNIEVVEVRL